MVAPLSDVPQEGSSVFSLFSLIKLHLASLLLASSYSRVAVSSVFCAQNIYIFGPNAWGPVNMDARFSGALLTNCYFSFSSCSRLVLFSSRTSSVDLRGVRWHISSFCPLFLVEQTIRGIFFNFILLYEYCSVELLVQIYFTSRLMVFLGFVLVSLYDD